MHLTLRGAGSTVRRVRCRRKRLTAPLRARAPTVERCRITRAEEGP